MVAVKDGHSSKSLFSQSWYRVADLKPRIRSHTSFLHHTYRGRDWYVLQDYSTGRFHRFSPEAYLVIGLMDGVHTMEEIWQAACARLGDDMPTQEEVINLLSYLHQTDVLQSHIPSDVRDLSQRSKKEKRNRWLGKLISPASMSFPIFNPDTFLESTLFLVRPLFTWTGFAVWCGVVIYALILGGMHWQELSSNAADRVLSTENLFLLAFIYPITRVLHELGHAYAVKRWGGEVHELGVMLIVFVPLPYVDASSASGFRGKGIRIVSGAAGIMVDLLLAAVAMIFWVNSEPGTARVLAYNVMFVGSFSTLLLNGNPLLRFDAYYILSDFLEIPNMGDRANKYVGYLLQRYILGMHEAVSPVQATGEEFWLFFYAIASFIYRIIISIGIIFFIAGKFFVIGVILAAWAGVTMVLLPIIRILNHIFVNMRQNLARIMVIGAFVVTPLVLFVVRWPLPSFTVTEGIVWVPEESQVFAGTDGFVVRLLAAPGSRVSRGDPLILCDTPDLKAEMHVLDAALKEVEARYRVNFITNRTETAILKDEMARIKAKLARAEEKLEEMVVRSPGSGIFVVARAEDMPGRFARKGTPLGYVVDFSRTIVRVVVNQADVDHIRYRTSKVEGRLVEYIPAVFPGKIEREVPAASKDLPSLALSVQGGGSIALDPKETQTPQAFEKLFHFDILLTGATARGLGERVFIRFVHNPEPLSARWYRSVRRVLLKRFNV